MTCLYICGICSGGDYVTILISTGIMILYLYILNLIYYLYTNCEATAIDTVEIIKNDKRQCINKHSDYIDKRICDFRKQNKWNTYIVNTTHNDVIKDLSGNIFTNIITRTFTSNYLKKHPCIDCGKMSTDRCHEKGNERPLLIGNVLRKIWLDTTRPILLRDIIIMFLHEHKFSKFDFKCRKCHVDENN